MHILLWNSSCVVQPPQLDLSVTHTDGKGRFGIDCWPIDDVAIAHTEARTVPGTLHNWSVLSLLNCALIQWTGHMCACRSNGVNGPTLFQQYCRDASCINAGELSFWQV